jgi:hypothetical protein
MYIELDKIALIINFMYVHDMRMHNDKGRKNKFFGCPMVTVCWLTDRKPGEPMARTTETQARCSESEKTCNKIRGKKVALAKALISAFPENKDIRRRVWEQYLALTAPGG